MARGERLDDATRAEVAAALLAGLGVSEVSRRYSLPKSTVSLIKSALPKQLEAASEQTRQSLDELLVSALQENLEAQARIARAASEAEFVHRQTADQVAALYEVLAHHSIRLLEAAATVEGEE